MYSCRLQQRTERHVRERIHETKRVLSCKTMSGPIHSQVANDWLRRRTSSGRSHGLVNILGNIQSSRFLWHLIESYFCHFFGYLRYAVMASKPLL